jgi:hypothetical protein
MLQNISHYAHAFSMSAGNNAHYVYTISGGRSIVGGNVTCLYLETVHFLQILNCTNNNSIFTPRPMLQLSSTFTQKLLVLNKHAYEIKKEFLFDV